MRLLGLTHSLSDVDGVGRYAVAVVNQAARFCDTITVLLGRKHRGISGDFPDGIRVRPVLPPDYFMYMSRFRFLFSLAASLPGVILAARRADLIHCFCDYPFSVLAWLAGKAAKKPMIISGHGTYSVAPFRYPLHRALIRRSYTGAEAVLFGSSFARDKFEAHLRLPNVSVLEYGVDVSAFSDRAPALPENVKPPYILCIGEVKERKGYEISVRAFIEAGKVNPALTFAVVGKHRVDDPYYCGLVRLLEGCGMGDRVRFLGNVSETEKRSLYSHSEAFILTPKESAEGGFEALGLVFLEAGASSVPVIGTEDSGAVCAIRDGENGYLIPPDRPEEGGEAILRILDDPALKRRLGDRGRQMAGERAWGRVGERLERIYTRLVSGKRPFTG